MLTERTAAERLRAAVPVIAVHALLGYILLTGLAPGLVPDTVDALKLFRPTPEREPPAPDPPPPPPAEAGRAQPLRQADPRPEGAASPPNLEAKPSPVVVPEPVVPPPLPPPPTVPAAPIAGEGSAASAGAAPVRGPGTGSGGVGSGLGSGSGGAGSGGGDGGGGNGLGSGAPVGRLSPPRRIAGRLSIRDMPEQLRESGFRGAVGVLYRVGTDGRVSDCRIIRPSGSRLMDQTTCRLIEQRFRFRPARDELGRPFGGQMEEFHEWESEMMPMEPPPRRRRDW